MANNSKVQRPKGYTNGRGRGAELTGEYRFIDRRLTAAEKGPFQAWAKEHQAEQLLLLGEVVASEHKASISFYGKGDCYIVSFTCNDERSPNWHMIMTSRSDDLDEALMLNLYKHFVLFEGRAWASEDLRDNWG